jgi:ribonuclease HI
MTSGWQAWFDGSALPNPGRMGIGLVLQSPEGTRCERAFVARESGCNNEAELHALCALLELAREQGVKRLCICGDSDIAVKYASGAGTTRIQRLLMLVQRAQLLMAGFEEVELRWVPRHRNGSADRLSRQALGLQEKPPAQKRRR